MAHIRACIGAVALPLAGVLSGRVDLVVLAAPFVAAAAWALMRRPTTTPAIDSALAHRSIREGEATTWTITITPADSIDVAAAQVALDDRWQLAAPSGVVTVDGERIPPGESLTLGIDLRSLQWGRRQIGPALVAASSAFGAFRFGPTSPSLPELTTLPLPTIFDSSAPVPSPAGLIGLHRSRRRGDGTEFATIRPFTVGDRLRRVNWPVSLRTGALHVATTHADSDTDVLLVVDATIDAGTSGGIDGPASSLDRSVRGAGAIAAHFLRHGDGIALRAIGSASAARVQVGHGTAHLRRILGQLATIEAGGHPPRQISRPAELARLGFQAGGLALVLSPLLSAPVLDESVGLARLGMIVLVIDTLPAPTPEHAPDPSSALAWRIRLLERVHTLRELEHAGIPIVAWRGPGTVDQVLRDLGRRAAAPRIARR